MLNWKFGDFGARSGGFSCIAVEPCRSTTGATLIGFNVDQPIHPPRRLAVTSTAELARTDHLYAAWSDSGRFFMLLGDRPLARPERLVSGCHCVHRLAGRLCDSSLKSAVLVAADEGAVHAWRLECGVVTALAPTAGLFTFSAGHSSADPLPGGGWLVEKLERLRHSRRLSPTDLEQALLDAALGDATVQTLIVDPSRRQSRRVDRRLAVPLPQPLRRSA